MVHITRETLNLLGNKYRYIPGKDRRHNEILQKYNIESFFIAPKEKVRFILHYCVLYKVKKNYKFSSNNYKDRFVIQYIINLNFLRVLHEHKNVGL